MNFSHTEEEREFAATIRRYALERLLPEYSRWDRGEPYPRERIKELADLGIMGLRVPEEHGGTGASSVMCGIAAEELSRGDYNTTLFLQIETIAAEILSTQGAPAVQREWLPRVVTGDAVMAFALTEPDAGSDAAAITTRARREGDEWVVSGEKASITFAGLADAAIVIARTTEEGGAKGMGSILVPLDRPGISRTVYSSLGERMSQRGSLVFDDVRVPADHMLGDERSGFLRAMEAFDYNRAIIALCCVGAALQSIEETIAYTKIRKTFGRPLATREGVAFQIAEHLTMVEAARLLAYQCLSRRDAGLSHTKESAMSKWLGPKASADAIHACILLHGWIGYGKDLPLEQRLRDVIGLEIGDGTPEIMKGIVAREVFGREFVSYR
jgi:cyclohexanecarboxyl-CoA dehydrogenase